MSGFSVPTVRAALVARFTAAVTVPVTYGHPGQNVPQHFVAVATSTGVDREQKRMPLRSTSMEEVYGVTVIVWRLVGDHDPASQQQASEEAWATVALLEQSLRNETTLGGLVTWALVTRAEDEDFLLNEGRAAQITLTVSVHVNRA